MHLRFEGIEIGCTRDDPLYIADYSPPSTAVDTSRTGRLGRDGVHAGPDFLREAAWDFSLTVKDAGLAGVLDRAGALERAWKAEENRRPGVLVPLEYSTDHGLTWFRVYGRSVRFSGPKADFLAAQGRGSIEVQFEQLDPLHYASEESFARIDATQATTGTAWRFPLRFPLSGVESGEPRAGLVTNRGDRPAPVRAVFNGPGSDFRVWGDGFEAGYAGALAHDQTVTLDGLDHTVVRRTGGARARHVTPTRRTRMGGLTLPSGTTNLWFKATDPTGVSHVDIYWRAAFTSMQGGTHV